MSNAGRLHQISLALGLVAFGLLQSASQVSAQPLAVAHVNFSGTGSGINAIVNSLSPQFGYGAGGFFPLTSILFDQVTLTSSDVGKTFVITAQNDPDFNGFVQKLTNGQSDLMCFTNAGIHRLVTFESNFFDPLPPGSNGVDLQGFAIGSITLTVDSLIFDSPGSNPHGNGIWTDITFNGTIAVYTVPEPSILHLLGVAGTILFRASARRVSTSMSGKVRE